MEESTSELQYRQSYSQEEVQQILHLAIARQTDRGELSRSQLWEIAAELAIEPSDIQAAEQTWLSQKAIDRKRQEFDRYRRDTFRHKAIRYLIANAFLICLNLLSAGTLSWSIYILLIWGLKLSLDAWNTFQSKGEAYEQAFQRWNVKNELKQSVVGLWDKVKKAWQS